jgi:hypothetical protein
MHFQTITYDENIILAMKINSQNYKYPFLAKQSISEILTWPEFRQHLLFPASLYYKIDFLTGGNLIKTHHCTKFRSWM